MYIDIDMYVRVWVCACVTRESSGTYVPSLGNIHDNRSPLKSDVDERARWRLCASVQPGFRLFGRIIFEDVTTDATTLVARGKFQRVSLPKRVIYFYKLLLLDFFLGGENSCNNSYVPYVWNLKTKKCTELKTFLKVCFFGSIYEDTNLLENS